MGCIVMLLYQLIDDYPIVIAGNRDEIKKRVALDPDVVQENPKIIAPIDQQGSGSYAAVNEYGVFAAVTNPVLKHPSAPGDKSRGLLVMEAAKQRSSQDIEAIVKQEVADHSYNVFNLIYADPKTARVLYYRDKQLTAPQELGQGIHILTNTHVNNTSEDRIRSARDLLRGIRHKQIVEVIAQLKDVCSNTELGIYLPIGSQPNDFGTLETNIIAMHESFKIVYWHFNRVTGSGYTKLSSSF